MGERRHSGKLWDRDVLRRTQRNEHRNTHERIRDGAAQVALAGHFDRGLILEAAQNHICSAVPSGCAAEWCLLSAKELLGRPRPLRVRLVAIVFCLLLGLFVCAKLGGQQEARTQSQSTAPALRTTVNEVLVPVVLRDARAQRWRFVEGGFQLFDNGKAQTISGFSIVHQDIETVAANSPASAAEIGESPSASQLNLLTQRFVVFLFDDFNLSLADLPLVQQAATKALDSSVPPADIAAIISTSGVNSGLTGDHDKLKQSIRDLKAKAHLRSDEHSCFSVDYYIGDRISNRSDVLALQAQTMEVARCLRNVTPEAAENIARSGAERAVQLGEQSYRGHSVPSLEKHKRQG
jgi:hypothetical protein